MKLSSAQLSRVSAACFWMPARDTLPGLLWLPWAMGLAVVCPWRIGKSIRYLCSMQGLMGSMSSLNSSCLYGWYGWAARLQVGQCHWCASQRKHWAGPWRTCTSLQQAGCCICSLPGTEVPGCPSPLLSQELIPLHHPRPFMPTWCISSSSTYFFSCIFHFNNY